MTQKEDEIDERIEHNPLSPKFIFLIGVFIICHSLFLIEILFLG